MSAPDRNTKATTDAMSSYIEQSLSTQKPKLVVTTTAGAASYEFGKRLRNLIVIQ